ncbi:helix-turn-helix domain-containing protein [Nonomuraea phyllanthi]|uniref:Helix-turn-helix domain-containing protein n=1 Tax=Nonomuraea phyllanthi TaxID=2219224 RepID=A0A5C4V084_9ACTN|nr:helix-turn-helix transcriptional regulator [Nonomuraea phyllanthi]KAB8184300.1 helix-turn-helix domain-containing protein [Nonomuraea phyllanthi]QFY12554.1 helix-turn-helix domain-containing protein [Nonomuraea phyllanthi]
MYDETTIGARLRTLRRWRGMRLVDLAGQAGMSKTHLSDIERGRKALDRRSYIAGLAAALRVSETDIVGGPHLTADPVQAGPHGAIPHLRMALQTNSLDQPLCDRARPLTELVAELGAIETMRVRCDYDALGGLLPDVVDELHVHTANPVDEAALGLALRAMVDACVTATHLASNLGYGDLAHLAARRAWEAAACLDEPVEKGKAAFVSVLTMPKVGSAGSWARSLTAAERAAAALSPHAVEPVGVQVLGMITLTASLSAAAMNNHSSAAGWLDEAAELAARVPDRPTSAWMQFSATNVGVWRVGIGVESGESGRAVAELAQRVDETRLEGVGSRRASFLADVGRGLARDRGTRDLAVRYLRRAENVAPQRIRNDARVRETVAVLLQQATSSAGGRELRGMAARMGVPH